MRTHFFPSEMQSAEEDKRKANEVHKSNIALWISAAAVVVSALAPFLDSNQVITKSDFDSLKSTIDSLKKEQVNKVLPKLVPNPKL